MFLDSLDKVKDGGKNFFLNFNGLGELFVEEGREDGYIV